MCLCLRVSVYVYGCTHAMVYRSEFNSQRLVLSFHHVGSRYGTRLDSRHLYPLSHLTNPRVTFINKYVSSDHIHFFTTPSHQHAAIQGRRCALYSAWGRQSSDFRKVTQLINTWDASRIQTSQALYEVLSPALCVYPQSPPSWPGLHSGPCKLNH